MKRCGDKFGQIKMSFSMIFSIILIVVFLAFAFWVIPTFLNLSDSVIITQFIDDLQEDVDKLWKSNIGSQTVEYSLPQSVVYVCFADTNSEAQGANKAFHTAFRRLVYGDENLFFYPVGSGEGHDALVIDHLSLEETLQDHNPLCFPNQNGKVTMILKKEYGNNFVVVES